MPVTSTILNSDWTYGSKPGSDYKGSIPTAWVKKSWSRTGNYGKLRKTNRVKGSPFVLSSLPYDHEVYKITLPVGSMVIKSNVNPAYSRYTYGNFAFGQFDAFSITTENTSVLFNKCLSKLGTRMNGASFNVPLFLAEAHKTLNMIGSAARDIAKVLRKAKTDREAHNLWLEYRYGWRLLVKDIYDALVAIHEARQRGVVFHVKVKSTSTKAGVSTTTSTGTYPPRATDDLPVIWDVVNTWRADFETTISLNYTDTYGPTLGSLQTFGITNPLNLAWELIPYSFVVDWFVPVGSYLATLDIFIGKQFRSGCISYCTDVQQELQPRNFRCVNGQGYYATGVVMPAANMHQRVYKRVALSGFPSAPIPTFQPYLGIERVLDAVSLMLQAGPGKKATTYPAFRGPERPSEGGLV